MSASPDSARVLPSSRSSTRRLLQLKRLHGGVYAVDMERNGKTSTHSPGVYLMMHYSPGWTSH